jgi:hypothetical protein
MPSTQRGASKRTARGRKPPRKPLDFDAVREIGLALPDVDESATYGAPALKIGKQLLACAAINKSAEPGSLMVRLGFEDRDRLVKEQPAVYYLTDHYAPYPCLLVRLSEIREDALRALLGAAWRFVIERAPQPKKKKKRAGRT